MWTWFHRLASPPSFYRFTDLFAPWLLVGWMIALAVGLYGGLVLAPADYQPVSYTHLTLPTTPYV